MTSSKTSVKIDINKNQSGEETHGEDRRFQGEVDGVHHNEDLLVLMGQAVGFPESCFAEILNPSVLPEERGRETQGQTQFEREAVNSWRKEHRCLPCQTKITKINFTILGF